MGLLMCQPLLLLNSILEWINLQMWLGLFFHLWVKPITRVTRLNLWVLAIRVQWSDGKFCTKTSCLYWDWQKYVNADWFIDGMVSNGFKWSERIHSKSIAFEMFYLLIQLLLLICLIYQNDNGNNNDRNNRSGPVYPPR